jgi:hypothetical protein
MSSIVEREVYVVQDSRRKPRAPVGGMSQWSPGMSMVGDMFNKQLQSKLDALCTDIATHLDASSKEDSGVHPTVDEVSYRSMSALRDWWPSGLGRPGAVGTQNSTTVAPSRSTIPGIIGSSGWPKLRVVSKLSRLRARMVS